MPSDVNRRQIFSSLARIPSVRNLHRFLVACMCLTVVGCASNSGTLQASPVVTPHTDAQSQTAVKSSDQVPGPADRASSPTRILSLMSVSDTSTGTVSKLVLNDSVADATVAIHNGSDVSIQLQTEPDVTGVTVDGDGLTPTALRRVSSGHWQGTFQYWNGANILNAKSKITVLLTSARGSITRTFQVTTLHDS
jgi:hypothetical protein